MKLCPVLAKRHQSRNALAGQLRPVVCAHELGCATAVGDDPIERPDGVVGVDRAGDLDRQRLPRVLVDDVQQLRGCWASLHDEKEQPDAGCP